MRGPLGKLYMGPGMLTEKRPKGRWTQAPGGVAGAKSFWRLGDILVISELARAELPTGAGVGPQ